LDNVVARFVDWMGGWDEVDGYGPQWSKYVYPSNHSVPVVMLVFKGKLDIENESVEEQTAKRQSGAPDEFTV